MVMSEIDSFVLKFKNLLHSEKDATLTIKSEAGRAVLQLSVELGHVLSNPLHHHRHPKNSPSRQRRRERRAAARNSEEETSKVEHQDVAEKATEGQTVEVVDEPIENNIDEDLTDEFCPDSIYAVTNDETLVEEILIIPDRESDWIEKDVENLVDYKLKVIGVNIVKITIERGSSDVISSCKVQIVPTPLKNLRSLPYRKWNWKAAKS